MEFEIFEAIRERTKTIELMLITLKTILPTSIERERADHD